MISKIVIVEILKLVWKNNITGTKELPVIQNKILKNIYTLIRK